MPLTTVRKLEPRSGSEVLDAVEELLNVGALEKRGGNFY
jgi:hypothetical protein